jgi:hypothetical protein
MPLPSSAKRCESYTSDSHERRICFVFLWHGESMGKFHTWNGLPIMYKHTLGFLYLHGECLRARVLR